ncbi:sensor histidine kinase [Halapricum hydrolyticum]|uniref:histidine kinase n=1 Tax=Halapricum hydrolyticum TaxID=2979991 RepID=A0AAE3IAN9_9EURY|nr:HAMP domain-containing sensor histidine kinase [Halapricum hydrolyticum]MCU4717458.1 HAMP domain-containing histidine kinase [Halapricum hydrolyticum]MCU4726622.1 HAMP domain-containing histidine kinase [Halapricum hydrolyticum]
MPELTPRRIAGVYLTFGVLWILFSDMVVYAFVSDPETRFRVEAAKGGLFVVVSGALVYWLSARAQQRQRETAERLRQQTRELSIFHRIVRHNLRNIATVIGGRTEAAREAGEVEPHLTVVERKADRLATLAEKASLLRGISAQSAGQRVEQDLAKAIAEICSQYQSAYPDASIEFDSPEHMTTLVPARMGFAVSELLENAIVHGGPDATVVVSLRADSETVKVTVEDDGPGLPDGERTAVEGDVEDVLTHSEGVGLWLVRLVVEKADGQLSVASSSLGGVAVTLSVPRADGGS